MLKKSNSNFITDFSLSCSKLTYFNISNCWLHHKGCSEHYWYDSWMRWDIMVGGSTAAVVGVLFMLHEFRMFFTHLRGSSKQSISHDLDLDCSHWLTDDCWLLSPRWLSWTVEWWPPCTSVCTVISSGDTGAGTSDITTQISSEQIIIKFFTFLYWIMNLYEQRIIKNYWLKS